jgi:hypothetical protein
MVFKKNIEFLKRKESAIIIILLTPIILILLVPALILLIIRGIFRIFSRSKQQDSIE